MPFYLLSNPTNQKILQYSKIAMSPISTQAETWFQITIELTYNVENNQEAISKGNWNYIRNYSNLNRPNSLPGKSNKGIFPNTSRA